MQSMFTSQRWHSLRKTFCLSHELGNENQTMGGTLRFQRVEFKFRSGRNPYSAADSQNSSCHLLVTWCERDAFDPDTQVQKTNAHRARNTAIETRRHHTLVAQISSHCCRKHVSEATTTKHRHSKNHADVPSSPRRCCSPTAVLSWHLSAAWPRS